MSLETAKHADIRLGLAGFGREFRSQKDTFRHAGLLFAAMAAVNLANFAFHIGAIRLLGLQAYSALAALLSLVLIFSVPANVIQYVITALVGEAIGRSATNVGALTRAVLKLGFGVAAAVALAGIPIGLAPARYFSISDPLPVYCAILAIGFGFGLAALRGLLQGQQPFRVVAASLLCEAGGNAYLGLGFIAFFGGFRFSLLGNVCAIGAAYVLCVTTIRKQLSQVALLLDLRRCSRRRLGRFLGLGL